MKRIGVCLSGGGIRSVAHLGALKALEELKYRITEVVGVSGGSIVASLYTHGYTVDEMIELAYHLNWLSLPLIKPIMHYLLKGRKQTIDGYVTYTMMNGDTIIDLPHATAVERSCRIPGFLAIEGKYMDGCVGSNYPMKVLHTKNKICLNAVNKIHPAQTFNYLKQLSYVNDMYVLQQCPEDAIDLITEYVDPLKANRQVYDRLINMGYDNTMKRLK